jgi:hypothetical protein
MPKTGRYRPLSKEVQNAVVPAWYEPEKIDAELVPARWKPLNKIIEETKKSLAFAFLRGYIPRRFRDLGIDPFFFVAKKRVRFSMGVLSNICCRIGHEHCWPPRQVVVGVSAILPVPAIPTKYRCLGR